MIKIMGIDPGLAETGYGFIEVEKDRYKHISHGSISTSQDLTTGKRLQIIYNSLKELIEKHKPDEAGIESLFFAKNISSAIPVAQARGTCLLCLENLGIESYEYSPQQIKLAIVGHGRAEKKQVQNLVAFLLGLKEIPKPDHASDALAASICHYNNRIIKKVKNYK